MDGLVETSKCSVRWCAGGASASGAVSSSSAVCVADPLSVRGLGAQHPMRSGGVGEATVILSDKPGRTGYGTIKNAPTISASDEIDHKGQ